jgi:hypothetical protein
MDSMRPMSEAPRDGTAVLLWWKASVTPDVCRWLDSGWEDEAGNALVEEFFAGWTPIVRPLEPDAPEPEAPILPPSMERATCQLFSAARESVALRQSLAQFQALTGVAHAQATKRAAKIER